MSEMVERGQSALKAYWLEHGYDPSDPDDGPVRAIILSMREPTEAMMAAVDCAGEKRDWPSGKMHLASWQAMIDEAIR